MSHLLLATKLYRPPPRPQWVERPYPTATLNQGLQNKLTLVSAPAGFGKTTLVSAALQHKQVGWLSLDERDNDPQRFFSYLIAAVQQTRPGGGQVGGQTVRPAIGQTALTTLQSEGAAALETVLTLLINELAALPDELILVLDDYHLIDQPDIHAAMSFWLDHLPPAVHQVILSRSDPPLPLARQSPARRAFLFQTAILERLHPDLCAAVTGRSDSLEIMLRMRQENLFLIPLDEAGHWFRYHHLFRDALLHLLQRHHPTDIPQLRRQAAAWFRTQRLPDEAIQQAILAQDFALAGDLIAEFGEATWKEGQAITFYIGCVSCQKRSVVPAPI